MFFSVAEGQRTRYESAWGSVESNWRSGPGQTEYEFTIPANERATVDLMTSSTGDMKIDGGPLSNAPGVISRKMKEAKVELALGSGQYRIQSVGKAMKSLWQKHATDRGIDRNPGLRIKTRGTRLPLGFVPVILALALAMWAAAYGTAQPPATEAVRKQLAHVEQAPSGPFKADWDSLGAYRVPEWYRDAKFGIFIHWGVFSVPAFDSEWYPRNMYIEGGRAFKHHVETYGPQSKFGYKDFIPLFRAEHFDPDGWVDLFARAGARYVVPVAEHCDGFAMYDSNVDPWNAAKMGPKRDVVGELAAAVRKRGLHFGASSHRAEHWWWYDGGMRFDSDVQDPRYSILYRPAKPESLPGEDPAKEPDPNHLEKWLAPDAAYMDDWLARSTEIVDKYHPDFFYFDWWIGQPAFQPYLKRFAAYYYNQAARRKQGVVLTYKMNDFPENAAVLDVERGKLDAIRLLPWETDTSVSIHSWGYVENDEYRTAKSLIGELVDVVSKNGNLLLNVGPKSDGTIPEEARTILLRMGAWLKTNGEAIYGSRPWLVFGEGPTKVTSSALDTDRQEYTAEDIRYTTNGGALYAIALGRPAGGELRLRSLYRGNPYLPGEVCSVRLLGAEGDANWTTSDDGLHIKVPPSAPDAAAFTFRIVICNSAR
ncbi:MAG TPA: alpha-L-fucosidase [Terracidiphilus sp.]|jgi:alpha-L-fucosidase